MVHKIHCFHNAEYETLPNQRQINHLLNINKYPLLAQLLLLFV